MNHPKWISKKVAVVDETVYSDKKQTLHAYAGYGLFDDNYDKARFFKCAMGMTGLEFSHFLSIQQGRANNLFRNITKLTIEEDKIITQKLKKDGLVFVKYKDRM